MARPLAIVPAFNEEAAIAATIADLRMHAPGFDVLVVDDGSVDDTARRARAAGATVLRHCFNVGIGGAVQSGYQHAVAHGYDVAVQFDGDGQHDARDVPRLLRALEAEPALSLVSGSRFLAPAGAAPGFRSSPSRRLGIRLFAVLVSRLVGRRVTDPTSGLRMCDRRAIELFARDYPHDYPEVEALLLAHAHGLAGGEVAVTMRPRRTGVSSIRRSRALLYMGKVLLAIGVGRLRAAPVPAPGASGARAATPPGAGEPSAAVAPGS